MIKILNRRFIAIQLIVLILISSILIPSVYCGKNSSQKLKKDNNLIFENFRNIINVPISSEDADFLLETFYEIEKTYNGIQEIVKDLEKRDLRDSTRCDSPLKAANDAYKIDTDGKSIEEVVIEVTKIADEAGGKIT